MLRSSRSAWRGFTLVADLRSIWLQQHYLPIHPPSTVTISPLTYNDARLASHTTAPLKSSGSPHRPAGIRTMICSDLTGSFISASFMSVCMYPGAIAFTLTPFEAHSFDSALVSCATPPFALAYAGTVRPPTWTSVCWAFQAVRRAVCTLEGH